MANRAVVLMSGGVESAAVLAITRDKYTRQGALFVNYGQRAVDAERRAAHKLCALYGVYLTEVELSVPFWSGNSLIDANTFARASHQLTTNREHIIAFRNLIVLGLAASMADQFGEGYAVDIVAGFDYNASNPGAARDKSPEFVGAVNAVLFDARERSKLTVVAPLNGNTKVDTLRAAIGAGVPLSMTWSCYNDYRLHCGVCGSCVQRMEAFQLLGIEDPAGYLPDEERP